jgi:hypothetical protein
MSLIRGTRTPHRLRRFKSSSCVGEGKVWSAYCRTRRHGGLRVGFGWKQRRIEGEAEDVEGGDGGKAAESWLRSTYKDKSKLRTRECWVPFYNFKFLLQLIF